MNGGSRSIVDGRVLAWCLAGNHNPVSVLFRYDSIRRPTVRCGWAGHPELQAGRSPRTKRVSGTWARRRNPWGVRDGTECRGSTNGNHGRWWRS
ncbi:hypothetical protein [Streptomyces sp. NPDC055709]